MLISLSLKNFRKHRELHLGFTEGLNLITGPNWAGKTSALSAIPFALFGTRATYGTAADLPSFGTTDMKVELNFAVGSETYRAVRTVKSATLFRGEVTLATGHAPVTAEVEKLLGTPLKDFVDFQVTSQGEADSLLSAGSAKMSDYVARAIGTDVVDRALERIKAELQGAKGALSALPEGLIPLAELQGQLDAAETAYREAEVELSAADEACKQTSEAQGVLASVAAEVKAKRDASVEARRVRAARQASLNSAQEKLAQALAELPEGTFADPAPIRERVEKLEAQAVLRTKQEGEIADLAGALKNAEATLVLCVPLDRTPVALQPLVDAREAAMKRYNECEQQYAQARKAAENSECPYCMRPFEDADLGALYAAVDVAKAALEQAEETFDFSEDALREATESNEALRQAEAYRESWTAYRDNVAIAVSNRQLNLVEPIDPVELENLRAELSISEAGFYKYKQAKQEVESATRWVDEATERLEQCQVPEGPSAEEVEAAYQASVAASEVALKAVHRWELATRAEMAAKTLLSPLRAAVEAETARLERWQHFTTRTAALQELGKFLRSNRDRFTSEFWTQLLSYASTLIQEATSGGVTRLFRSASGDFMYEEGGREIAVEGFASGMQRAIFGTAIKLSLAAAIGNPFPVMLFDEVTAAAQDEVSLQFTSLLASAGKQVIMVTHRGADAAAADNLLVI